MKKQKRITWLRGFTVFVMLALVGLFGFTYMSLLPGPVSKQNGTGTTIEGYYSHADFEMGCGHCHAPIHCVSSTKCQDCHMDVADQRASESGLHGNLPNTGRCNNCHIEHQGRDNDIRTLAYTNVNHYKLSGFSLDKHQADYAGDAMDCQSCHSQDDTLSSAPDCVTCHVSEDHDSMAQHIQQLGSNCLGCHDGIDRMDNFAHEDVYPLEGSHAQAECSECHLEQVFAGTPQACSSCHHEPDVHEGQFGQDCARCHNAIAWAPAYLVKHTFELQHSEDQTTVECQQCHASSTYTQHICTDCHDAADPMHNVHQNYDVDENQDCTSCHPTGAPEEALEIMKQLTPGLQDGDVTGQNDQNDTAFDPGS